jgi:hypothetical protein
MHHIDELLTWLAYLMVRDLNVQLMQFWANQASSTNRTSIVLRATASQDGSLPQQVVVNAHVAEVAGYLLSEHRGADLQPVNSAFSRYQADLLRRYGLNYCFGHFLSNASLLPPLAHSHVSDGEIATPFAMIALLFWRHPPFQSVLPTVITILDKVELAAKQRNLLLPPDAKLGVQQTTSTHAQHQRFLPPLAELIPQRMRDTEAMRAHSPFTGAATIPEGETRRLYLAIDGRKSVAELASITHLMMNEMVAALRILLAQKHIQICDQVGQPIDDSWVLDNPLSESKDTLYFEDGGML